MPRMSTALPAHARFSRSGLVAWSGALLCLIGLLLHRMWVALALGRFAETLLLAAIAAALAWPLRRWRDWAWADALALVWGLALVWFAGPWPVLAVALFAAAAIALGSLLVRGPLAPAQRAGLALVDARLETQVGQAEWWRIPRVSAP